MNNVLEIDSILKKFDERWILSDIYLKVEQGKVTGLLGRNGAGKSTLMKIISGSIKQEKSLRINGKHYRKSPFELNKVIGYLPQHFFIPKSITLKSVFNDFNLSYDLLTSYFPEFSNIHNKKIRELSGGQRRIFEIYLIIKHPYKFILLDEPFTFLAPIQIEKIKVLINIEKKNKGFLISDYQYIHTIEVSDNLYYLKDGKTKLISDKKDLIENGYLKPRNFNY